MAHSFGLGKKRMGSVVYLFDLGSGSVGGSVVHVDGTTPKLLAVVREPISFHVEDDLGRLRKELMSTITVVMERLQRVAAALRLGMFPKEAHAVLASPWHLSQTHIVEVEKKQPFEVTPKILRRVADDAKRHFMASCEGEAGSSVIPVEQCISRVRLNGYATRAPYGKHAKHMEAACSISCMPQLLHAQLGALMREKLMVDTIEFHSCGLVAHSVIGELFPEYHDFLILDVNGETADLGLVRDGVLRESVSFPWGRNLLLREITLRLGTIPEEAHSLIRMQLLGAYADLPRTQKTRAVLAELGDRWLLKFAEACAELSKKQLLPANVFLMAFPDIAPWFGRIVEHDDTAEHTAIKTPFSMSNIDGKLLSKHHALAPGVAFDSSLALGGIFIAWQAGEVV